MIEEFNREYEDFFNEPNYQVRWQRLTEIHSKDYSSFRVLFAIETLALLDKWREPTSEELNFILKHKMAGGQVAVRIGNIIDLLQPVWPLEVAKLEFAVYRAVSASDFLRRYVITGIRSYATALVQTWWAWACCRFSLTEQLSSRD